MADLLSDRIELGVTNEELMAFSSELGIKVAKDATDLEIASEIIGCVDGLDDDAWEAMTMALKEWSNAINNAKIAVAEQIKKEEIAAKAQKTKKANAAADGFPTTPAAIAKAINACKNKAEIAEQNVGIAKALGMDSPVKITKGWTVAKQKEAAIAGLKKPKDEKPSKPSKPAGPARTKAPSAEEVKDAKAKAKATAATKAKSAGAIKDGEPFRRNTSSWIVWDIFAKDKKKTGVPMDEVIAKFKDGMKEAGLKSVNEAGRVKRVIAELKKRGLVEKHEKGNFILAK